MDNAFVTLELTTERKYNLIMIMIVIVIIGMMIMII